MTLLPADLLPDAPDVHHVAYHNLERMGQPLAGPPFTLWTDKPVQPLLGGVVWFVVGRRSPRQYTLAAHFRVAEVGDVNPADDLPFAHFAAGPGCLFREPIPLNDLPWFGAFLKAVGHFGLGVMRLPPEQTLRLQASAIQHGIDLP